MGREEDFLLGHFLAASNCDVKLPLQTIIRLGVQIAAD